MCFVVFDMIGSGSKALKHSSIMDKVRNTAVFCLSLQIAFAHIVYMPSPMLQLLVENPTA